MNSFRIWQIQQWTLYCVVVVVAELTGKGKADDVIYEERLHVDPVWSGNGSESTSSDKAAVICW